MKHQFFILVQTPSKTLYFMFRDKKRKQWRAHSTKSTPIATERGAKRIISRWLHPSYHAWCTVCRYELSKEDCQS